MSRRTRKAIVPIAGQNVELVAPGLKQIKRKHGVDLYWAKDDTALFADYRPATVHKVRNHQVVDEWHSLVNPQRPIPAKIVELTGITNQMVRDAPVFHEVADSFVAFMGDGIFVAHNVNFDYGFLSYEYERLERRFRFPKLCTCVGMRRRYPGHKSYGLGKLCAIYDIELEEHHRALCDARAAARLLNLINKKRDDGVSTEAEQAA